MNTHRYEYECEKRDDGKVYGWAECDCGWKGTERAGSTSQKHRRDYIAHVEAELGEMAYYEAPVVCLNCAFQGSAQIPVGFDVWGGICPMCSCSGRLRPDNEARDEEHEHIKGWLNP